MKPGSSHTRTDAAQRRRHPQDELLLWVLDPTGVPAPDWTGRAARMVGGRGVHLLPTAEAVRQAVARGAFRRAWTAKLGDHDAELLVARFVQSATAALEQRLGLAVRAGRLAVGQASVSEAMAHSSHGRGLLLVAADATEASQTKFARNAARKGADVVHVASGSVIGRATGREFVSVAWIDDRAFVTPLRRAAFALAGVENSIILKYEDGAVEVATSAEAAPADAPVTGVAAAPSGPHGSVLPQTREKA